MIEFSVVFGLFINMIVLFLLTALVILIKDLLCNKFGEDAGLSILIAVMSVLLVLLSNISNG